MSRIPYLRCALAVALALGALSLPTRAAAQSPLAAEPRAAIVFVPGPPPKAKPPMIERLAAYRQLAIGFESSVLGAYEPEQSLIDMSAGSRIWKSLYDDELPPRIRLATAESGGTITGWNAIRKRAASPPADIVPGSLAQSVRDAGLPVSYVGIRQADNREAIVAADRQGAVERVFLEKPGTVAAQAVRRWRPESLMVTRLPGGSSGAAGLSTILQAQRPRDLVFLVQQPTADPRRLLALGVAGLAGRGTLRSDSTRLDGLVIATDIAPTVLDRLGLAKPHAMTGELMETGGSGDAKSLTELRNRLSEIGPRRWMVILSGFIGAVLLCALALGRAGARPARLARPAFLAALWMPSILLVTGALAPTRVGEILAVAIAAAVLALATDRLLRWPRAIVLPAAVTILAHAVDLAFGSVWTARSLFGPNPILGARFYGIGNELEVTLAVIGLIGLGAALATAPEQRVRWGFLVGGGTLALIMSWGRLGADVGASIMLAAGVAAAATMSLGAGKTRFRVAAVLGAPVLAVASLAALDLATGGDSHFTRSVLRAGGLKELGDVAGRRLELSYHSLRAGWIPVLVGIAAAFVLGGIKARERVMAPLRDYPGLRAGLVAALVGVVAGALANDSGPIIFLIGTVYLALSVGYFQASPSRMRTRLRAGRAVSGTDLARSQARDPG